MALRATDVMIAGVVVIAGYGDVGKGCAEIGIGLWSPCFGLRSDPICAYQASLPGDQAATMEEAAPIGDIFVTARQAASM